MRVRGDQKNTFSSLSLPFLAPFFSFFFISFLFFSFLFFSFLFFSSLFSSPFFTPLSPFLFFFLLLVLFFLLFFPLGPFLCHSLSCCDYFEKISSFCGILSFLLPFPSIKKKRREERRRERGHLFGVRLFLIHGALSCSFLKRNQVVVFFFPPPPFLFLSLFLSFSSFLSFLFFFLFLSFLSFLLFFLLFLRYHFKKPINQ